MFVKSEEVAVDVKVADQQQSLEHEPNILQNSSVDGYLYRVLCQYVSDIAFRCSRAIGILPVSKDLQR